MEIPRHALRGEIEVAVSAAILDETLRVLDKEFDWPAEDLESARFLILSCARTVAPKQAPDVVEDDPSDNRILECAAEAGAESAREGPVDPDHKVAGQPPARSYELNCTP